MWRTPVSRSDDVRSPGLEPTPEGVPLEPASPSLLPLAEELPEGLAEGLADALAIEAGGEDGITNLQDSNLPDPAASADRILQETDSFIQAQRLQLDRLRQQLKADRQETLTTQEQHNIQLARLTAIIQQQQQRIQTLEQQGLESRSAVITEEVTTQEAQLQVKRLQDTIQQRRRMITALENQLEDARQDLAAQQKLAQSQTQVIVALQQELASRKTTHPLPKAPRDDRDLLRIRALESQVRTLQSQIAQLPKDLPDGLSAPQLGEPVLDHPIVATQPTAPDQAPDPACNPASNPAANPAFDSHAINPGPMLRALPPLVRQPRLRVVPEPSPEQPDPAPHPESNPVGVSSFENRDPDPLDWVQARANELKALKVELKLPTFLERREIPDESPQSDEPDDRLPADQPD
jgi:hypothetical protein